MKQGGFVRNQQRFLSRIRRDVSGNTIALVAAALVPLTAMIGGGVDVARIYMTKTRLQQACDAGSLAGRKVMGSGVWTTTGTDSAKSQAESYFHANFTEGTYGSYDIDIEYTEDEGTVNGQATATLPLVIMHMFAEDEKQLTVSCDAALVSLPLNFRTVPHWLIGRCIRAGRGSQVRDADGRCCSGGTSWAAG